MDFAACNVIFSSLFVICAAQGMRSVWIYNVYTLAMRNSSVRGNKSFVKERREESGQERQPVGVASGQGRTRCFCGTVQGYGHQRGPRNPGLYPAFHEGKWRGLIPSNRVRPRGAAWPLTRPCQSGQYRLRRSIRPECGGGQRSAGNARPAAPASAH